MITRLYGGPMSGKVIHLPQAMRAFAVGLRREYGHKVIDGEYRIYDWDEQYASARMIWFDPNDIEEAKRAKGKDERHEAQDLMRALREARAAATELAREEGMRKAAAIQARWEATMSDTMRARLQEVAAQARAEVEQGARFASSDEELWAGADES